MSRAAGICGAWSTAIDAYDDVPWTSYVTLLHPVLEFEVVHLGVTVKDLVAEGVIEIEVDVPLTVKQ